jgi:hypothetical protein
VPLLFVLVILLAVVLAIVVLVPVSLVLRYRAGKARRQARGWVASLNVGSLALSVVLCLAVAGVTSLWLPGALTYVLAGLAAGSLLGAAGLALARWESTAHTLHFTPKGWLVLIVTAVVAARLTYGVWRAWHAWGEAGLDETSRIVASGVGGSLAAAGLVLGYYLTFWIGVLRRVRLHQRRSAHLGRRTSDHRRRAPAPYRPS